jgi:nitrile hydratase beta subunit
MNGIHDMGGMHGFGPIVRDESQPLFPAPWARRVAALNRLTRGPGFFNVDEFRYGIERMAPADYLRSSYLEKWLTSLEFNLIEKGYLSLDELEARMALLRHDPDAAIQPAARRLSPPPATETSAEPVAPRFAVGDTIVTRNAHPAGHTRLPRYARGKQGVIHQLHGVQTFPDSHAHGCGRDPRMLYTVRFAGQELWGESAEANQAVYLDLWEPYLLPATTHA